MDSKAQTSTEALILIAAVILIATVVGVYLLSIPSGATGHTINELRNEVIHGFE